MSQLDAVLDRIDSDLDRSLERLFAFLRIPSVSTDPAFKAHCQTAAQFVAEDLKSIGFSAELRGHRRSSGGARKIQQWRGKYGRATGSVLRPLRCATG